MKTVWVGKIEVAFRDCGHMCTGNPTWGFVEAGCCQCQPVGYKGYQRGKCPVCQRRSRP